MAAMNDVFEGMKIIFRHATHEEIAGHNFQAGHEQIWSGAYSGDKMSPAELAEMERLGWFEDEDSWSKFT